MIANKEKNFEKYLSNHFGIVLPSEIEIFYAKGIRVGKDNLRNSKIIGELGYAACDFGFNPTNAFIMNFGHLATKNMYETTEGLARSFADGHSLKADLGEKDKFVIVKFQEHVIGLGKYIAAEGKISCEIPEKNSKTNGQ
jgi:NOL1/NOP2/fmu family ribosome biogenesis protein